MAQIPANDVPSRWTCHSTGGRWASPSLLTTARDRTFRRGACDARHASPRRRCPRSALGERARGRTLNAFVVGQVAMALLLVLTAGLFVSTFRQLTNVPLGFESDRLLLGIIDAIRIPGACARSPLRSHRGGGDRVPGVRQAGGSIGGPLTSVRHRGHSRSRSRADAGCRRQRPYRRPSMSRRAGCRLWDDASRAVAISPSEMAEARLPSCS